MFWIFPVSIAVACTKPGPVFTVVFEIRTTFDVLAIIYVGAGSKADICTYTGTHARA